MAQPKRRPPNSYAVLDNIKRITQRIEIHSRDLEKRYGLTGPQLWVLLKIRGTSNITASDLAREVRLSQATLTGILERLEDRGLLERKRDTVDRRCIHIWLTPEGKNLLDTSPPLLQESFLKAFRDLASWEQNLILATLERIADMMAPRQKDTSPSSNDVCKESDA